MEAWAEVRQLVSDFQQIQSSETPYKLSERNCIELVTNLYSHGLVDLHYTLDGREYVTPLWLEKEIRSEIQACQGNHLLFTCLWGQSFRSCYHIIPPYLFIHFPE